MNQYMAFLSTFYVNKRLKSTLNLFSSCQWVIRVDWKNNVLDKVIFIREIFEFFMKIRKECFHVVIKLVLLRFRTTNSKKKM